MNARLALLLILLLCLSGAPARAAAPPPSLRIQSINDGGTPDLFPGQRVAILIELRSEETRTAFAQHLVPDGLILEAANANTGVLVTEPFPSWTGMISGTQPLIVVLRYRVAADAEPGDRVIRAQAQIGGQLLRASNVLRVCCISAPPPQQPTKRCYLPIVRH